MGGRGGRWAGVAGDGVGVVCFVVASVETELRWARGSPVVAGLHVGRPGVSEVVTS